MYYYAQPQFAYPIQPQYQYVQQFQQFQQFQPLQQIQAPVTHDHSVAYRGDHTLATRGFPTGVRSSDYTQPSQGIQAAGVAGGVAVGFAMAGPLGVIPGAILGGIAPAGLGKVLLQHELSTTNNPLPQGGSGKLAPIQRRTRAVAIGIAYNHHQRPLKGTQLDARNMSRFLQQQGYQSVVTLIEGISQNGNYQPTRDNIIAAAQWLVQGASPGDSLFFYYSGHGYQQPSSNPENESDGMDEVIVPVDERHISDDELFRTLVAPLPAGSRLTALFDCCHGGTMLDLPFSLSPKTNRLFLENRHNLGVQGDVIAISATRDHQQGLEQKIRKNIQGAVTFAFLKVLREKKRNPSYAELLQLVRREMIKGHLLKRQSPELTCSKNFDLNQPFQI